ncbi:hypothetical protein J6590_019659 [Homalodisca vitripennis]|nr:hypothetical protein J6590_019659 [Homalodisca vitripennis]
MLSLSVPHLVPAGTDLYRAILGELSHTEWCHYFLAPLSHILINPGVSLENENLFNYWMLPTIKKVPSALDDLLEVTSINIYSFISLLRIKRKEGFPGSSWEEMNKCKIKFALEDYSDKIRSQAFSLICTSSKASISPNVEEYNLVQQYFRQNINSDSTVLRQSLLNSFTTFIIRLRDMLLHFLKNKNTESPSKTLCFEFLDWLHSFLLFNLDTKCNYQRKYTSLELYMIVLMYFGEPVRRKEQSYSRKSNKSSLSLRSEDNAFSWSYKFESLSSQKVLLDCLFDGDNDVRLSAGTILTTHFKISQSFAEEFEHLFNKGLSLCSSSIFYNAESGARIVQVLVILASNCSSETIKQIVYNGNALFFSALLSSAEEQFTLLKEDLLKAASQGSFLYGTLQTLTLLLTDPESPEFMLLDANQLERLLHLMEENTQFFLGVLSSKSDPKSVYHSTLEYAPSFGEMGMAIAAVVESSSLKDKEVSVEMGDDTSADLQLTPAQQLVLSCIWLNLKESSVLCSKLVSKPLSVRDTERCVTVVVSVLRRCRHKGAIESAGLALYHITKYITSSPITELQALPSQLMEWCLTSLVGNTATTVSRRSAGLAILVHRLITGDSRHTKPLLHNCVARLLEIATDSHVIEGELLVDLPQSQALHFLRTLVQEASLREHMAQYMLKVSLVALSNLSSHIWTIRNAALQLIGAIVPKLVGQKPHQEEGRGNHHVAFEELYFHAKPLVKVMLNEFFEAGQSNSMNVHSKLMPLLTLVTNLVAGVQSIIAEDVLEIVQMFRKFFILLFKSNIFNVRKLSAKAHSMFLTSSELVPIINERVQQILAFLNDEVSCNWSENELHGYLLNLTYLVQRFNDEKSGICLLEMQGERVKSLLDTLYKSVLRGQHSYFVKSLVFELNYSANVVNCLNISDNSTSNISLGLPHFISKHISNQVQVMHNGCDVIKQIKQWLLKCQNYDIHLSSLKVIQVLVTCKSRQKDLVITDRMAQLVIILKDFIMQKRLNTELLVLSLDIMLNCLDLLHENHSGPNLFCPEFNLYCHDILDSNMTPVPVLQLLLPIVCGILSFEKTVDMELVEKVAALINKISDPRFDYDQDRRVYAAKSMLFLTKILKSEQPIENQCASLIWKACVHFLQDEVTDVRYEASRFVTYFKSNQRDQVWNPYVSLEMVFSSSFMTALMPHKQALACLLDQMHYDSNSKHFVNGITNPFDHGVNSIYEEKVVVAHLASCSIIEIEKNPVIT